jgi:hypothetical protein
VRCIQCGGVIREARNGSKKCDSCGYAEINGEGSPDVWELAEHPEDFDTEAARQRTKQKRFL